MWIERPLAEIATITSGGTPARDVEGYWGGEIPWVTPSDITACTTNVLRETKERITAAGLAASAARMVPAESILLTSRATVGEVRMAGMPLCTNQGFKALTSGPGIDPWFLYYQVQRCRGQFERFAAGSTFLEIGKRDTERVRLGHPADVASQKRIATILTSLDTAIEATEALIEKHQHIKAGLMHDLFTRGVLSTGELRPAADVAPDSYRSGLLGVIPRSWREVVCRDLCSRICVGIVIQPAQYYTEAGVPALRSANVRENEIDPTNMVAISDASNVMLAKSMLRKGDIVTVRTGYPGTSAVVPPELDGANCIDILISSPGAEVDSRYLCYWLNSPFGKGQVLRKQGGLAQQHFNVGDMRELVVALPDPDEQLRICATLERSDAVLRSDRAMLEKLRLKKHGLMQDLLTGKVRVPVPADASA